MNDNFLAIEKNCLKNCSSKYIQQFNIFNSFKSEYENKYSTRIFLFEEKNKEALEKFLNLMKVNNDRI